MSREKGMEPGLVRRQYGLCLAAAACIFCLCFSLLFSPLVNYSPNKGSRASGILLSTVTWLLVAASAGLTIYLIRSTSYYALRDRGEPGKRYRSERIGLLTLAANPEGLAAEIAFGLGAVLWILRALGLLRWEGLLRMLPYSLSFAGFLLHCFFNGKTYRYLKRKIKSGEKRGARK